MSTEKKEGRDPWLLMDVHLRRESDGLVRVYSPSDWGWHESSDYQWTDGNFGCDCNRYLFFQRAADEEEMESPPCGGSRYTVTIFKRGTEEVLFRDRQ